MIDERDRTADRAQGQWVGILTQHFGVDAKALDGRHHPCPICRAGEDRFRFDNKEGRGTWICSVCGAGDGFALIEKMEGLTFKETAARIDDILGQVSRPFQRDPIKPPYTVAQQRAALRQLAGLCAAIEPGDPVDRYLASRSLHSSAYPPSLRTARQVRDGQGGVRPAMVATLSDVTGEAISLHTTFLEHDGSGKAPIEPPRRLAKQPDGVALPDGACVRLHPWKAGPLGIAEGIETALSAARLYRHPVWAALNTSLLMKWSPPDGVEEVVIYADGDENHAGQAAAHRLAHRLIAQLRLRATVRIPGAADANLTPGMDFNDLLQASRRRDAA